MKFGLNLPGLFDGALGFEQDDGFVIDAVFCRHHLLVLIQKQGLQDALALAKIRLNNDDIFRVAIVAELEQVLADDDLIAVFLHHRGRGVIMRDREFQQQVAFTLRKDALDGVFPTLKQHTLRSGLGIHVMRFICDQHDPVLAEVFKGNGVLFLAG